MNEKKQLYEQYEDAIFALIMNEVAEKEGERLLEENERLKSSKEVIVPDVISSRCLKVIAKEANRTKLHNLVRKAVRTLNRVAIIILIPIMLFVGAFAASETVRINTLNFIIDVFDEATLFRISDANHSSLSAQNTYFPNLSSDNLPIPSGYELTKQIHEETMQVLLFEDSNKNSISISILDCGNQVGFSAVDTEDSIITYERIGTIDIMIIEKGNNYHLVWLFPESTSLYEIEAENALKSDLLKIAESIILCIE